MSLLSDFTSQIQSVGYWQKNEPVIVGVSGGVDSIVLLTILEQLPDELKPSVHVAHINHQLRKESDEEEGFVRRLCADYNVPFFTHKWDKGLQPVTGLESAAREIRYTFFKQMAEKVNSRVIMTAHHKDDQVETVLMRLVRGNSLDELTGIQKKRQSDELRYIRPLLSFSKNTIKQYAIEKKLTWYEDVTNQSEAFTRNRFRHKVLPLLRQENEAVDNHIADFADELTEVLALLQPLVEQEIRRTMKISTEAIQIDRLALLELTAALKKRILEQAVRQWSPHEAFLMKRVHSKLLVDWIENSSPNSSIDLPNNLTAVREYNSVRLSFKKGSQAAEVRQHKKEIEYSLYPDQWMNLSEDQVLGLLTLKDYQSLTEEERQHALFLDLGESQLPLRVRHRRDGDRMSLKGMQGTKKVKDIFIDQKIPLKNRSEAWVVSDNEDEIVWLIGYKESALSLDPRTDTISYVLVYKTKQAALND